MKRIFSILLLIMLFMTSMNQLTIIINYLVNKSYIENYLCEQRNNPNSTCHGTCHLFKQLQKNAQESEQKLSQIEKINTFIFIIENELHLTLNKKQQQAYFKVEHNTCYLNYYLKDKDNSIFHPPLKSLI